MIYRLRVRLGAWCLKWHVTALLEHYEFIRLEALRKGEPVRAERCAYMGIGVRRAAGSRMYRSEILDARIQDYGRWKARPWWRRIL